jgi:hypothetical protein
MMTGDCETCGAPAPIVGEITHARDCPQAGLRGSRHVALPPLRTLTLRERAALVELARKIEAGWREGRRARRAGA